jgi:hypothetical protein
VIKLIWMNNKQFVYRSFPKLINKDGLYFRRRMRLFPYSRNIICIPYGIRRILLEALAAFIANYLSKYDIKSIWNFFSIIKNRGVKLDRLNITDVVPFI